MEQDRSIREHIHINSDKFQFRVETYAPTVHTDIQTKMKTSGKPRFNVEMSEYVSSVGWDNMDIKNVGNEIILGFIKKVEQYETFGYEHNGLSSKELKELYTRLWGNDKWFK